MKQPCCQSIECSIEQQWRHGGSSGGKLLNVRKLEVSVKEQDGHYLLKGFFLRNKKTVSNNSKYLVR